MARTSRSRSKSANLSGGSWISYYYGTKSSTVAPVRNYNSICTDYVGRPVTASPFSSRQYRGRYPGVSGYTLSASGAWKVIFDGYTSSALPAAVTGVTALAAPSGWALDLVAGTNPSRPVIGVPMWAQNIKEFPKMVKQLGDIIANPKSLFKPKGFAGEYLGVRFGWLPLIDDLQKLLHFQDYVLKRDKELQQLYSGKGLRRRLQLASETTSTNWTDAIAVSGGVVVSHKLSLITAKKSWGTIRWYPSTPPGFHPSDAERNRLARQLVAGLTPEGLAKGLWDVIPWTWLIGWFTNFGKYALAHSYTVPASHGPCCYMAESQVTLQGSSVTATGAKEVQLRPVGVLTTTLKTRSVTTSVTAGANMPYLDMSRLSILGALFVQRFFR